MDRNLRAVAQSERRARLEQALAAVERPVHLTPMTRDPQVATDWLSRFEGAGLDGVIAKPLDRHLRAGQARDDQDQARATADCVVAGFRWHKDGRDQRIGSLLLGSTTRQGAPSRRRDLVVHDGDAPAARR
jgi:ATP-dependent DNA ligase